VGFEPTIPAAERAITVHGLDRATTVTSKSITVSVVKNISRHIHEELLLCFELIHKNNHPLHYSFGVNQS
jgi:hypothetical protein